MKKKINPYLISYLSLAIVCCIALSVLFLFINLQTLEQTEEQYHMENIELVLEDWEQQISTLKKINMRMHMDGMYQPYSFQAQKYNEIPLLNDLRQYIHYSPLIGECFLHYTDINNIFYANKDTSNTIALDTFLTRLTPDEELLLTDCLESDKSGVSFLRLSNGLYVILPFKAYDMHQSVNASLCFTIPHDTLDSRIAMVGGGLVGDIALYQGDTLLYSTDSELDIFSHKSALHNTSVSGNFQLIYVPESIGYLTGNSLFPLYILLFLSVVLLLLAMANLFASHSYKPIQNITSKYKDSISISEETDFHNDIEKINCMIDTVLQRNTDVSKQLEKKQSQLIHQLLSALLNNQYFFDTKPYLEQLNQMLPGPYFFVANVLFHKDDDINEEFLIKLKNELEQITEPTENNHLYGVIDCSKQMISIVCSVESADKNEELNEYIRGVAESFEYHPLIASGGVYTELSKLSASCLESMDTIHKLATRQDNFVPPAAFTFRPSDLQPLCAALTMGNEEQALEFLNEFTKNIESHTPSLLMQQYIFSVFLSEFSRLADELQLELSHKHLSLLISAKNIRDFSDSAREIIHMFCKNLAAKRKQSAWDETYKVYQYMNEHFMDYDMSIDKVARDLATNTAFVRKAIHDHTGKTYKDYIIQLRIEYAKNLLVRDQLTVAETCQKVGYGNISHFIKVFKSITGKTPANYRDEC